MADPLIPLAPLRLRHGQGESLSGRDFSDQAAQDDQLRWWHNRALHRAYGVAQGLEVDLASEPGTAVVSPGLAYDQLAERAQAWRELMFADEDQAAKATRDPVAPARRSAEAEEKAISKQLDDGTPVHSFQTLLEELSTIVRNTCRVPQTASTFPMLTIPNDLQLRARELIDKISV